MPYKNRRSSYSNFILIFVAIKIVINLVAMSHYGFQRDELLHLALADHLDWGYKEVPPFIALLGKISLTIFGDSVFATRIFSTLCSGLIIWLAGHITACIGGRKFAISLTCLALIFSPAFAASGYLFQPVVFDQFWWVLSVWLLIKYLNTCSKNYLYYLGVAVGFGLLTKYTMAFFAFALIAALLISKQRKALFNRHVLGAATVALLIFLPNIIWQFTHHLPVFTHMKTLQSTQLDNNSRADFIKQVFLVNGSATLLWLAGFISLLLSFRVRKFQFLAFAFVIILLFLIWMQGKPYYLFGAFPMLFAAGAYGFERWLKTWRPALKAIVVLLFTVPNLILFPMVLPILPINSTVAFFEYVNKHMEALRFATTWEDKKLHNLTQDYADMLGWQEIAQKTANAYHSLTPEQQKNTIIFADNYGEAGAIHRYGRALGLPEVISLSSSFALWAPDELTAQHMIYISDDGNIDDLKPVVGSYTKTGTVENKLAREHGTAIYLLLNINPALRDVYKKEVLQTRKQ